MGNGHSERPSIELARYVMEHGERPFRAKLLYPNAPDAHIINFGYAMERRLTDGRKLKVIFYDMKGGFIDNPLMTTWLKVCLNPMSFDREGFVAEERILDGHVTFYDLHNDFEIQKRDENDPSFRECYDRDVRFALDALRENQ